MDPIVDDILMHYGVKRRSGRYPWGSGENPYQHGGDFLARVEELEALGKGYPDRWCDGERAQVLVQVDQDGEEVEAANRGRPC